MNDAKTKGKQGMAGHHDADEAKKSARRESHPMSVPRAVRNVNQLITREKDGRVLQRRACEILTETRGYRSAWIVTVDKDGSALNTEESGIGASFAVPRQALLNGHWPECARRALDGDGVAVVLNPGADCGDCPLAVDYQGSAALAAALRHENRDYGVLVVSLPRASAGGEAERSLVTEVAGDLALAFHALDLEAQRRAADAREAHLKRVLLAIRNVNQLIVHEEDRQRLIERACENLTETLGYFNAWIALLDDDGRTVTATACAGFDGRFDPQRRQLARGEFSTCMRRALERNETIVVDDPKAECHDCLLSNEYGGRAGFTRRLAFDARVYGILAVSVPAEFSRDGEALDLFDEVAGDLGFALRKIEWNERLRESDARVRSKLNALLMPEGDVGQVELSDVIDLPAIQEMMNLFHLLTGIGMAIVDLKGAVLVAAGWQDLCTKFHRVHPETRAHCIESDTVLSSGVAPGSFKIYRCKNSLWDIATPIMLGDRHAGNLFLGQFLFEGEEPDRAVFRGQARRYGFDEKEYLAALDRLPRWSRERVTQAMTFYAAFARQISDLSFGNIKLARTLVQRDELLKQLGHNEADLRRALQLLTATEALSAVGGWEWDVDTRAMTWTAGTYRIHDLEPGAIPPGSPEHIKHSLSYYDPDDRACVREAFRRCVEKGESYDLECGFTSATGRRLRVRTMARAVREGGRVVRVFGNIQDITEQKMAEQALKDSQARFVAIFRSSPMAAAITTIADGRIEDVNLEFERIVGRTRQDCIGRKVLDLGLWVEPGERAELVRRMRDEGPVRGYDCRIRNASGEVIPVLMSSENVCFDQAEYMLTMALDVSRRNKAEEALLRERQWLRFIIDGARLGTWIWNVQTNETVFNETWANMLGYTLDELTPYNYHTWERLVHPEDIAMAAERLRRCAAGETPDYECEFRLRHKAGNWVWILDRGRVMTHDAAGAPLSMFGMHLDITERKRAEAEKEMLQSQLLQAQKLESVGQLAGGVAHDFNNMLNVILGHAELALEKTGPAEPLREHLTEIFDAGRRSADITRQLLAFARRQIIAPRVIPVNDAVGKMLKMLRRLIGEDIELAWKPGPGLWPVNMDPAQIDQILANLVVNARDAIDGVGKITIETGNVSLDGTCHAHRGVFAPGDYVRLAVGDNGCGMDEQTLGNLFEPFFTTKKVGEGTGLGLATVYGIVRQNNGFINVDSEPGQGAIFKIYLPRHLGPAEAMEARGPSGVPTGRGETVLVVEDEAAVLRLTRKVLERLGYAVLAAPTPAAALELAGEHAGKIDLLMTDVVMPEMNGRDLAAKLQTLYPGLKVLFMSGYTANVIAHHGILKAGVRFIQKPFNKNDLAGKVKEALFGIMNDER